MKAKTLPKAPKHQRAAKRGYINWATSREEATLIAKIVQRAMPLCADLEIDVATLTMDLTAAHLNGTPLDLERLLEARDFDFEYDVLGIHRHIDRRTGRLTQCFLPRTAR
jgi:hypothetical protein